MNMVNIADFKKRLSAYLERASAGEEIVVAKRNMPLVRLTPIRPTAPCGRRAPGAFRGSIKFRGDVVAPALDPEEWGNLA